MNIIDKYIENSEIQQILESANFGDFKKNVYVFLTQSISSVNRASSDKKMIKTLEVLKNDISTLINHYKKGI